MNVNDKEVPHAIYVSMAEGNTVRDLVQRIWELSTPEQRQEMIDTENEE